MTPSCDFLKKFKYISIERLSSLIFNLESPSFDVQILKKFKIGNTHPSGFKLYGIWHGYVFKFRITLDRLILQMKIKKSFELNI